MAAVTPIPGAVSQVTTGGTAVAAIPANPAGGYITNPALAADQGLGSAEPLFIDPVINAITGAHGTTFALQPGQTWNVIPGQTTATSVNAASSGHRFSVVYWT